ncbi:DUF2855 family protein [Rhodobacteraceae bacterium F11138]|nr:DUF2855 family protein [Rhodobacteraceae bacterium F11138]
MLDNSHGMAEQIGRDMIVRRTDLSKARIETTELPDTLPPDSCLLRINGFALTANNITYGVAADMLGYWEFFPTDSSQDGRIPVWGFATVIASTHPKVPVGERLYGYLPMSTHLIVHPGQISDSGFQDMAPHRAARAAIYNHYSFCRADPQWQPDLEPLISLFRPLFTTSFLLDDLHRENMAFGAEQILLSSASSKTAIGLAFLLSQKTPGGASVVGLTSAANRSFTQGLRCYDRVYSYDEIHDLPRAPAAYVDMAGSADLRRQVHTHFKDTLYSSRAVGMTHWPESRGLGGELPGARPEFFFAPDYARNRIQSLGPRTFQSRRDTAWSAFVDQAQTWFTVVRDQGDDAVLARYHALLDGRIDPSEGNYLSL